MTSGSVAVPGQPLRFVESKPIDWTHLAAILETSTLSNQWTNGGPAVARLEAILQERFGIDQARSVIVAASATAALFASAGVMAHRLGRPVRWIGSSFGFFSGRIGPFSGSIDFVDCGHDGSLDLAAVERHPPDSWDGLLVTNVFGSAGDLSSYADYCRAHGKLLLADNALALYGFDRSGPTAPDEVVSFHHTKPWGFGEGGCAVLPREDAALFRHLANFGHRAPPSLAPHAANGKMSDLAAAAIIARLETEDAWATGYRAEWERIAGIGLATGLRLLNRPSPGAVPGFVAFLAPGPVPAALLADRAVPMAKYYPPLSETPVARDLYDRNVCIACHPGMASLADDRIAEEIRRIAGIAGEQVGIRTA